MRSAATFGFLIGTAVSGSGRRLIPRWSWFDLLPIAATISFSISTGINTTFRGVYTDLLRLTFDWSLPYLIARALLKDRNAIRGALMSLALCTSVLATLAIIELLFDVRIDRLWKRLGAGIRGRPFWVRFGFRRTFTHFSTPVSLGAYFVTIAPLMVLWRIIDPRRRRLAKLALVFTITGCLAAGSRGPLLSLVAVAIIIPLLAHNPRLFLMSSAVLILLPSPIVASELNDRIQYTQVQLDETGNVDSGHYRVALWMIYGDQIGNAGWFGDPSIVGAEYEAAWSIDNSYLYLLLTGGWLGGGPPCGERSGRWFTKVRAHGLHMIGSGDPTCLQIDPSKNRVVVDDVPHGIADLFESDDLAFERVAQETIPGKKAEDPALAHRPGLEVAAPGWVGVFQRTASGKHRSV